MTRPLTGAAPVVGLPRMDADHLSVARWTCVSTCPGAIAGPAELPAPGAEWMAARVPGTAAGALRDAARWEWGVDDEERLDGRDWWFRTAFPGPRGDRPWELRFDGLATIADVWLNGEHLAHSENMFVPVVVGLERLADDNELVVRCAALSVRLAERHPRPRFKSRLPRHQSLRWYRTSLLGRMPGWSRWAAPVGPSRPVTLTARPSSGDVVECDLRAECLPGDAGRVSVRMRLRGADRAPGSGLLDVDGVRIPLELSADGDDVVASGALDVGRAERWWPHTHGPQPLSAVSVVIDDEVRLSRRIGFRTVELDREDGGFTLRINARECFLRGVTWGPVDAVALTATAAQVTADLELARDAGVNLIRLGGYGVYEDRTFWDECDRLGIMVWQDCMIAAVDPPDDDAWFAGLAAEVRAQFTPLQGRPALAIVAASTETYQQGAVLGLSPDRYRSDVLERRIPHLLSGIVPDVPYIPSTPSGGDPPIRTDLGVSHYFGVGAYLRPVDDARLSGVRFAAECLSFANPPENETVQRVYGTASAAGHDPRWKLAVARDAGTSWDFEDVRDHYVRDLFGVDPLEVRYSDPEWALDLGRAAVVELVQRVLGQWRTADDPCAGAVMLAWRDLWPGAGWGVVDSEGLPKSAYFALRRACAPVSVALRDRGLNGLAVDILNDRERALDATLDLSTYASGGSEIEAASMPVSVPARSQLSVQATTLLGGFRDLTAAYRFSPSGPDAVLARLRSADGEVIARSVHLPGGCARPRSTGVGLSARVAPSPAPGASGATEWMLTVASRRLATFVALDVPGHLASDSWFHLAPGESVTVTLRGDLEPHGTVRALNAIEAAPLTSSPSVA